MGIFGSGDEHVKQPAMDLGQSEIGAVVQAWEPRVVGAQQVQRRRVDVIRSTVRDSCTARAKGTVDLRSDRSPIKTIPRKPLHATST